MDIDGSSAASGSSIDNTTFGQDDLGARLGLEFDRITMRRAKVGAWVHLMTKLYASNVLINITCTSKNLFSFSDCHQDAFLARDRRVPSIVPIPKTDLPPSLSLSLSTSNNQETSTDLISFRRRRRRPKMNRGDMEGRTDSLTG